MEFVRGQRRKKYERGVEGESRAGKSILTSLCSKIMRLGVTRNPGRDEEG